MTSSHLSTAPLSNAKRFSCLRAVSSKRQSRLQAVSPKRQSRLQAASYSRSQAVSPKRCSRLQAVRPKRFFRLQAARIKTTLVALLVALTTEVVHSAQNQPPTAGDPIAVVFDLDATLLWDYGRHDFMKDFEFKPDENSETISFSFENGYSRPAEDPTQCETIMRALLTYILKTKMDVEIDDAASAESIGPNRITNDVFGTPGYYEWKSKEYFIKFARIHKKSNKFYIFAVKPRPETWDILELLMRNDNVHVSIFTACDPDRKRPTVEWLSETSKITFKAVRYGDDIDKQQSEGKMVKDLQKLATDMNVQPNRLYIVEDMPHYARFIDNYDIQSAKQKFAVFPYTGGDDNCFSELLGYMEVLLEGDTDAAYRWSLHNSRVAECHVAALESLSESRIEFKDESSKQFKLAEFSGFSEDGYPKFTFQNCCGKCVPLFKFLDTNTIITGVEFTDMISILIIKKQDSGETEFRGSTRCTDDSDTAANKYASLYLQDLVSAASANPRDD